MKFLITLLFFSMISFVAPAKPADEGGTSGGTQGGDIGGGGGFPPLPLDGGVGGGVGGQPLRRPQSPPLTGAARTLDLSSLSTVDVSCSFAMNNSEAAQTGLDAINNIINSCYASAPSSDPGVSSLQAISRIFGEASTDPQSCLNYERTYDQLYRRVQSNPGIASSEVSMCVRIGFDGDAILDEQCLFRTIARLKEARRAQCSDQRWQQERQAQNEAIQDGVRELDRIFTQIIDNIDNTETCPGAQGTARSGLIQSVIGTAAQILSIPYAGTGIDLVGGLIASGLSRLFGESQNNLESIRNDILNTTNFTNLACIHENLQNQVNNCSARTASSEYIFLEQNTSRLQSQFCEGVLGGVSTNLENFLGSISQIRSSFANPDASCQEEGRCVQNMVVKLSEVTGDGRRFGEVLLDSAQENLVRLEERYNTLTQLEGKTSGERRIYLASEIGDDSYYSALREESSVSAQDNILNSMREQTQSDLAAVRTTLNLMRAVCPDTCANDLSFDSRRTNLEDQNYVSRITGVLSAAEIDPVSAMSTSLLLRTDTSLHGGSNLSQFAQQFAISQQIQSQQQRLNELRTQMFAPTSNVNVADTGPQNAGNILRGLETALSSGGSSLLRRQVDELNTRVASALSGGCQAQDEVCRAERSRHFENSIKTAFMVCNQLHTFELINGGNSQPSHSLCRNFNCAYNDFPVASGMPSIRGRDNLANKYNNEAYSRHICSNLDQKDNRLNLLRNNFLSTGSLCPQATASR